MCQTNLLGGILPTSLRWIKSCWYSFFCVHVCVHTPKTSPRSQQTVQLLIMYIYMCSLSGEIFFLIYGWDFCFLFHFFLFLFFLNLPLLPQWSPSSPDPPSSTSYFRTQKSFQIWKLSYRLWNTYVGISNTTAIYLWSTDIPVLCGVRCSTRIHVCVSVQHRHDTRISFYILNITCVHVYSARCSYRCFVAIYSYSIAATAKCNILIFRK